MVRSGEGVRILGASDGQPDVFCHISVVHGAGFETLAEGATVICDIVRHPRNAAVTRIHALDTGASPCVPSEKGVPAARETQGSGERRSDRRLASWAKRFNPRVRGTRQ